MIQPAALVAVLEQVVAEAVTDTVPVPPPAATAWLVGVIPNVQLTPTFATNASEHR